MAIIPTLQIRKPRVSKNRLQSHTKPKVWIPARDSVNPRILTRVMENSLYLGLLKSNPAPALGLASKPHSKGAPRGRLYRDMFSHFVAISPRSQMQQGCKRDSGPLAPNWRPLAAVTAALSLSRCPRLKTSCIRQAELKFSEGYWWHIILFWPRCSTFPLLKV